MTQTCRLYNQAPAQKAKNPREKNQDLLHPWWLSDVKAYRIAIRICDVTHLKSLEEGLSLIVPKVNVAIVQTGGTYTLSGSPETYIELDTA